MSYIEVQRHGSVALLTLNDERRRNALSPPMVAEIIAAFDEFEGDDEIGAVVITGTPPAFCSGADVGNLAHLSSDAGSGEREGIRDIYQGFLRVLDSPLPTVAAVNGPAVGAGFNLALACDVRMAGSRARFDSRFAKIGLHPGGGHVWLVERAVGPQQAAAMVLFGDVVDAERSVEIGLARSLHEDSELVAQALDLAEGSAGVPAGLRRRIKSTLRAAPWQPDFDAAVDTEVEHQTWSFAQGWFK